MFAMMPKPIITEVPVLKWFAGVDKVTNSVRGGNVMDIKEKQRIAAEARSLIRMLDSCDDDKFVDFVVDCVVSNCDYLLEPENLWHV